MPRLTYIGGSTALIEWAGARLLTDPTLDPEGTEYPTPVYTLRKTIGPALPPEALLPLDAVLLSHDHHFDNLDHAGRRLLSRAGRVLTTAEGAARIGRRAGARPVAGHRAGDPRRRADSGHGDAGASRPAPRRPGSGDRIRAGARR